MVSFPTDAFRPRLSRAAFRLSKLLGTNVGRHLVQGACHRARRQRREFRPPRPRRNSDQHAPVRGGNLFRQVVSRQLLSWHNVAVSLRQAGLHDAQQIVSRHRQAKCQQGSFRIGQRPDFTLQRLLQFLEGIFHRPPAAVAFGHRNARELPFWQVGQDLDFPVAVFGRLVQYERDPTDFQHSSIGMRQTHRLLIDHPRGAASDNAALFEQFIGQGRGVLADDEEPQSTGRGQTRNWWCKSFDLRSTRLSVALFRGRRGAIAAPAHARLRRETRL